MNLKTISPLGAALIVTFGCALALLLKNLYLFGYYLDRESAAFLENYLADRPLLDIIFDPARNDWKMYQARELSYFFDCLDARFIGWSLRHGCYQFYTLSGFLMLTSAVFVQQYGIRTLYPKLPGWIATLLSFAYVLIPCSTIGFFRSSKYGCALTFTIAGFLTLALFQGRFRRWKWKVAGIAVALLGAALFDRQGAFFAASYASAAGFLLLLTQWNRFPPLSAEARRILLGVTAAALAAVLAGTCYNLVVGPKLIYACNHYMPDFSFQNMSGSLSPEILPRGGRFLFRNLGHAFLGATGFAATLLGSVAAAGLFALLLFGGLKLRNGAILLTAAAFAAALAGCWVAAAGMAERHPAILVPVVMFGLYFLPGWSLLLPFFAPAAETVRKLGWKVNPAGIALAIAVAFHLGSCLVPSRLNPEIEYQRTYQEAMPAFRRALADPGYDWRRDRLPVRFQFLLERFRSTPK